MGASGLGSLLVKEGFLTEQDRLTITKTCGQGSWAFAKSILAIGLLDEDELAAFFAERTRYQIAPKDFLNHLDQSAIQSVDRRLVSKLEVIPLKKDHGKITVGVVDPLDRSTLKQLEFFTGFEVDPVVIPLSQLYEGLVRIDPEFRYQPTALTHFLQNHAQSAWVRQKLESDDGISALPSGAPSPGRISSSPNDIEEIYDDLPEIEEVEEVEDSVEIEEDEFAVSSEADSDSDFEIEASGEAEDEEIEASGEADDEEIDPFAGAASASLDHDDGIDAEISSLSRKDESDDLLELDDGSENEGDTPSAPAQSYASDFDSDLLPEDRPLKDQDNDFDFEMDEIKADSAPMSTFGFEETKPRAAPSARKDILDNIDDPEPSLDLSKLPGEELDPDLLADLHSEIEADDHSPNVDPSTSKINFGLDDEPSVVRASYDKAKPSFMDEEETHIDLRSAPSAKADDDDDILLHPETAALKTQSDFGLNPTSAINELMVKLSLCWNPEGALQVLRENLHKIGEAGALLNTKSQHQILWADGASIELELGPAALLPIVRGASLDKWQSLELKASESWTQKAIRLKIYRTGDWMWAHNLKVNDDTAIFRDTVESAVSQVALKLGR